MPSPVRALVTTAWSASSRSAAASARSRRRAPMRYTFSARVLPGVRDTRAMRRPTRTFSRLDLPTLERPMRASSGSGGSSETSARGNDPTKWGRSMLRPGSGFLLLADALGHEQWGPALRDAFGRHGDLAHVITARPLGPDVRPHLFPDGAQAARAGAALDRLLGDGFERLLLDGEPHVLELEQLLVLLGEGVLGLDEDTDERVLGPGAERHHHRQPAHELGDEAVAQQVVGLDVGEGVALDLLHDPLLDLLLGEPDLPPPGAGLDDLLEPVEGAAADEEDVPRVDLDVLLLRVLSAALRRHARDRALEDLEQRLLHALTRHVAGDARGLGLPGDLVDLVDVGDAAPALRDGEVAGLEQPHEDVLDVLAHVARFGERRRVGDGEGHVQDARQRLGEQRLADACRADQHDVALVELDVVVAARVGVDALVMVVDRDGEGLLRPLLADHVLVQHLLDLGRGGDLRDGLGDLALLVLRQDLVAEGDALIANVDRRTGNELPDRVLRLAAERAAEVLIVGHRALVWETAGARARRHFFLPSSISL